MFQVLDSGRIKNSSHANICVLLSKYTSPSATHIKSPSCLPQKWLPRLGDLVVAHVLLQPFKEASGKENPDQMLDSFGTYTVDCPAIGGHNKTILISDVDKHIYPL